MKKFQLFAVGYLLSALGLFFYSYTQVDLNLTLSQWSVWQVIQTSFQHIGWFQRPLSTFYFLGLVFILFVLYFLSLRWIKKNAITNKQFWWVLLVISAILLFSYNAFSYDLFNYMFDARIITLHHLDPYGYKALDFPHDPWINFMRWTHRTYPYGAAWLGLTVPLSFAGMQFFLPTLFLFKSLMAASFIGSVYFIGKILGKLSPRDKLFGMAFFALNPLVIIESLVSAHNDIVMMFFALLGIYMLVTKKYVLALVGFLLSAYIKFINDPLPDILHQIIPVGIVLTVAGFWKLGKKRKEINWDLIFVGGVLVMTIAVILASQRTELQPWYALWIFPFVALLPKKKWLALPSFAISLGLLLHYVPFLYTGNWNPPIPSIKMWLTTVSIAVGILLVKTGSFKSD